MPSESARASRRVAAAPADVFAVLTDPGRHASIDGTGWVSDALDPAPLTVEGQRFRMRMFHDQHPDKHYEMTNEVVALDAPNVIAWRPGQPGDDGVVRFGGWVWRYDVAAADGGSSDVTITYDWSAATPQVRDIIQFPPFGPAHLDNSLAHLEQLARESG